MEPSLSGWVGKENLLRKKEKDKKALSREGGR